MKALDNRYLENVIKEMMPFFDEHGFKAGDEGCFKNEKKAVKVEYNDERQMFVMNAADVTDGIIGEYGELSAWLFDDTQTASDATAVGIDFTATLRENLGIKIKRAIVDGIDLPTAQKNGVLNTTGFTKKVLDVYPQYKDSYKEHISKYGNYLYIEFFSVTLIPQIKEVLAGNNKKTVKKLFDMLEIGYINGDKETVNIIVACLAAAVCHDETLKLRAFEMLEADSHFKSSVENFIPVILSQKKLSAALIK